MQTTNYGAQIKPKLITGRKDKHKDGPAVLKLRVPEIPADAPKGSVYERYTTESGEVFYRVFASVTGIVTYAYQAHKQIMGQEESFLFVDLESGGEPITWEVGRIDSRYAMNLMARILNPYYMPSNPANFAPYAFKADGKDMIGVSVQQGADKVPTPGREVMEQMGQPHPRTWEGKGGKTEYDFSTVAAWMLAKVREKISAGAPTISRDNGFDVAPTQTNVKPSPAANTLDSSNVKSMLDAFDKQAAQPVDIDDLPF
jgi:hypothetical protein